MKTYLKERAGAIFFYLVIVVMTLLVCSRFNELQQKSATEPAVQIAQNRS